MFIEQALFGYSNGHHLLSSSINLPLKVLKILEPLSDLSGSDYQEGFLEYISGYYLIENGYFALSKTWYANEMKRPGCVWTHTLLIKNEDLEKIFDTEDISSLFCRPENDGDYERYQKSIEIFQSPVLGRSLLNENLACNILVSAFERYRPVFIPANSSEDYESTFIELWLSLGSNLLMGESFCTGSLTNRTINKKNLDYQIIPSNRAKNIVRMAENGIVLDKCSVETPLWIRVVLDNYIYKTSDRIRKLLECIDGNKSPKYIIKSLAKIISVLQESAHIELWQIEELISTELTDNEKVIVINTVLIEIIKGSKGILTSDDYALEMLKSLSVQNDPILEIVEYNKVFKNLEILFKEIDLLPIKLFKFLIESEINVFGEKMIVFLSEYAYNTNLKFVTGDDFRGSNVLIGLKPELAYTPQIWNLSQGEQIDILESLRSCAECHSDIFIRTLAKSIFINSDEMLSQNLVEVFGSKIVEYYLELSQSELTSDKIRQWVDLCSYDIEYCIKFLPINNNDFLNQEICKLIDPYSNIALMIETKYWVKYYQKYIKNNDENSKIKFAYFILPIMLRSNQIYPKDMVSFAFKKVHELLENDSLSHREWKKLSGLLPEIAWNNSWDKCKRLRKASKKIGYNFEEL